MDMNLWYWIRGNVLGLELQELSAIYGDPKEIKHLLKKKFNLNENCSPGQNIILFQFFFGFTIALALLRTEPGVLLAGTMLWGKSTHLA